jgi:hypothetical protein
MMDAVNQYIGGFYDVVTIDSGNIFVLLSDDVGTISIYNQRGDLIDTFIHLHATPFGENYPIGNYLLKFSCNGVSYETSIIK